MKRGRMMNILFSLIVVGIYFLVEEVGLRAVDYILAYRNYSPGAIGDILYNNYYKLDSFILGLGLVILLVLVGLRARSLRSFTRGEYISFSRLEPVDLIDSTILLLGVKGLIEIWFMLLDSLAPSYDFIRQALYNFETGAGSSSYKEAYIYVFLSVVLLGPIVEELIFRGIVYREMEFSFGSRPAIVISALAFGIFHWDLVQTSYTLLIGLLLAYVYNRYRNFGLLVYLHMLNNFLETLPVSQAYQDLISEIIMLISIISIVLSVKLIFKFKREDRNRIFTRKF